MGKKGITLVEVIISVGLISIVMLFLFNLLMDMQYEEEYANFAKKNQLNRASIIKYIEEDFLANQLIDATVTKNATSATITLRFLSMVKTISITKDKLTYNNEEAWTIDGVGTYDIQNIQLEKNDPNSTCSFVVNVDIDGDGICNYNCEVNGAITNQNNNYRNCSSYDFIKLVIPIVTTEEQNVLDDIELFYIRKL